MEIEDGRELDEVRRLLYMTIAASRTERHSLAGTLTNALAHHGFGVDPDVAMDRVITAIESGDTAWVRDRIREITKRAEELPDPEQP